MNKVIMTLTLSAFVFGLSTADAVWGTSNRSNNGYTNQNTNGQSFTDIQRNKHQARNSYYVEQNGGTATNRVTGTNTAISGTVTPALLIQTARQATIERDIYGDSNGFVLTLKGVDPNLAFFNNGSQRSVGKVSITDFVNNMANTNGASAALVTTSTTPDNAPDLQESIIILTNPVYDSRQQTLKFNIDNLNGERLRAGSHQNPILLIDSTYMNQ